jgi:SAM-dependent methyltransferase
MINSPAPDPRLSRQNKAAWDALYGSTSDLVWGSQPIGFLETFLPQLRATLPPHACILDAGTGEGRNLSQLLTLSERVYGCDASPNAVAKIPAALGDRIQTAVCDLGAMPFEDQMFDFILLADVVETLPNPQPILQELARILRPGGLLLCNIPGFEDSIAEVDMAELGENQYLYQGRYFYRFVQPEDAIALLHSCGFQVVHHQLCSWIEAAHPEFRHDSHSHSSYVFLVTKPAG